MNPVVLAQWFAMLSFTPEVSGSTPHGIDHNHQKMPHKHLLLKLCTALIFKLSTFGKSGEEQTHQKPSRDYFCYEITTGF
jgi:hypothetical protein